MTVNRTDKTSNYTVMSNHHLRDNSLSLSARGLMSIMLSLPDDWDYSINGLAVYTGQTKSKISTAIKQLEEFGYIRRHRNREKNGVLSSVDYIIEENPSIKPKCKKPTLDNPALDNPTLDKSSQLNTNNNQILSKQNTNNTTTTTTTRYNAAEKYLGRLLNPSEMKVIESWVLSDEMVDEAIRQAELNNIFAIAYIDKIITRWQDNKIETVRQTEIEREQFTKKKSKGKHPEQNRIYRGQQCMDVSDDDLFEV